MKQFAKILKWFIGLFFILVLAAVGCFVAVFAVERNSPDDIFLLNYAFVAEKEEDGLNVWIVKKTEVTELKTGDGVIYFNEGRYCAAAFDGNSGEPAFYCGDGLNDPAPVTNDSLVGQVVAAF